MKWKGVCYDVGRVMMGEQWRPTFDPSMVHRELEIIKRDLHCNAVRICGFDLDRLMTATEDALTQGLDAFPQRLGLSIGSELTLNAFLARAGEAVRQVFHGNVTYFSVPLEMVDWSLFDFVGVDLYRETRIKDAFGGIIQRYFAHHKPVIIGEFGCCTYQGAEDAGGRGWAIVDPQNPLQLGGDYVRDEGVQARELIDVLRIFDGVGVDGAFVFTFVAPALPSHDDPKYDLDMASYSLVKSFVHTHGTVYPDMPWEPKESFQAVAEYYAAQEVGGSEQESCGGHP